VALSTDGRWIVAAGYQNPSGVFERVDQRYEFRRLVGPSGSTSHELVLNPAQPVAALAYLDRTLRLIDYETGSIIAETPLESHAAGMSFASDGRLLACGSLGGPASVFDGRTLKVVHQLQSEEVAWCTVFSLDDRFVAVGNRDGGIAIWEVATGRRKVQWKGHDSGVTELIFSDNESLISCDSRGNLRRWNIRAVGRELKRLGVTPNEIEL
jgi:WD40 repeat protein